MKYYVKQAFLGGIQGNVDGFAGQPTGNRRGLDGTQQVLRGLAVQLAGTHTIKVCCVPVQGSAVLRWAVHVTVCVICVVCHVLPLSDSTASGASCVCRLTAPPLVEERPTDPAQQVPSWVPPPPPAGPLPAVRYVCSMWVWPSRMHSIWGLVLRPED